MKPNSVTALLLLAACAETPPPLLEAPEDALLIIALADREGRALSVDVARGRLSRVELAKAEYLAAWILRPEDLLHADGTPVTPEELNTVDIRLLGDSPPPFPTCDVCLVPRNPTDPGPGIVLPGSRCPPPNPAALALRKSGDELRSEVTPEVIHSIRQSIMITLPPRTGEPDCACTRPKRLPPLDLTFCPVFPEDSPYPFRKATLDERGNALILGEHHIIWVLPDGRTLVRPYPSKSMHALAPFSYPGDEVAFLVAGEIYGESGRVRYDKVFIKDDDLELEDASDFLTLKANRSIDVAGVTYFSGQIQQQNDPVGFARCADGICRNESLAITGTCSFAQRADDPTELIEAPEHLIAISQRGSIATRSKSASREEWRCRAEGPRHPRDGGIDAELSSVSDAIRVDDHLLLCGTVELPGGGLAGFVGRLTLDPVALTVTATRGEGCQTWLEGLEHPVAVFSRSAATVDDQGLVLTVDGLGSFADQGRFREVGRRHPNFDQIAGRVLAMSADRRTVWRGPTSGPLERIYGPDAELPSPALIIDQGHSAIVVEVDRAPHRISASGDSCDAIVIEPTSLPALPARHRPVAGTRGSSPDELWILSNAADGFALSRVGPDSLESVPIASGFLEVAELSPGRLVGLKSDGKLEELNATRGLDALEINPLEISFDDPATVDVEAPPDPRPGVPPFVSLHARNGVAWAAGDRAIARVTVGPVGATATGHWFRLLAAQAIRAGEEAPPLVSSVFASCPNDLVLGVSLSRTSVDLVRRGQMYELADPTTECAVPSGDVGPLDLARVCKVLEERSNAISPGDAALTFRSGSSAALLSSEGELVRAEGGAFHVGHAVKNVWESPEGLLFFSGQLGLVTAAGSSR